MNSHKILCIFYLLIILTIPLIAEDLDLTGKVYDKTTGQPIPGVNISSGEIGVASDESGSFSLTIAAGNELTFSHIGYETITLIAPTEEILVHLLPKILEGLEVFVSAARAVAGVTPVAFSTLTAEEIRTRYTVEDVPMVLALEPGVHAYSESGNGTGYSYLSIRGFDQSRIAVMLDNVPLNDNESHQVYWVDHADILSDARDVQIQRGIGNSLYGSSAFGGSINVTTRLSSMKPGFYFKMGSGSYSTSKFSLKGETGPLLDEKLHLLARYSQLKSDGYRDYHNSDQKALFVGGEYASGRWENQFRALIGYENTNLTWWGVEQYKINDRKLRRTGYQAYTDDFLQQIYSLNTTFHLTKGTTVKNVAYLVKGAGYYRNYEDEEFDLAAGDSPDKKEEFIEFLQSYNLDQIYPNYPLVDDSSGSLGFTRRKWIVNSYYGLIPVLTFEREKYRIDIGGELRFYSGDHYGEVTDFSNSGLVDLVGDEWHKYYQYFGAKTLYTGFMHLMVRPIETLRLVADLQIQSIHWTLDQKKIGHAAGHQLSADWQFVNPRFGAIYSLSEQVSLFVNFGRARKEPADSQIIEADDVFDEPVMAAAEVIDDYELGSNFQHGNIRGAINLYRINYKNEQLKNIDVEQEGEYAYYSAACTHHQGLEFELSAQPFSGLQLGINGSISNHVFSGGVASAKKLPGIPMSLLNLWLQANLPGNIAVYSSLRQVGRQYMPAAGAPVSDQTMAGYAIVDLGIGWSFGIFEAAVKINNLFDKLYATNGYDWDGWLYYWPGATRNAYLSLVMKL
ncbi:MAG: TonB-dependent receptor [Candidatus Marinimicrobia bacterium]|nr:TonB-dependent receptor [Candidatus Neomarinimicrobiota bacterium]